MAHFFAFDLPHSDACYIRAYPAATAEAWADGHVHAFAFFGRVPLSVLYDSEEDQKSIQWIDFPTNRCLVARILPDGTRKRAEKGAEGIEGPAQAEGRAAQPRRRGVGHQRVARRAADALADPVDEAGRDQPTDRRRQRKDGFRQGGEAVAHGRQFLASSDTVGERPRKDLGDRCRRLSDALDDADGQRSRPEAHRQVDWK